MFSKSRNLKKYSYFSGLSESALEELSKKIEIINMPAETEIIRKGEVSDAFYMLHHGDVELIKKNKEGRIEKLSLTGKGEEPGEMALLTSSPGCVSVTARTDVNLYKILKNDFEDIVCMDSVFSGRSGEKSVGHFQYRQYDQIKALHPFSLIKPEKMLALADKLEERRYAAGENIIKQGEPGDIYYIIKSGKADVLKLMFKDEPEYVATLGEGQGFGEEALITDQPRNATVRAVEETVVWTLSRPDFDSIMKSSFMEEIFPEDVLSSKGGEILLDVRFDIEFEESHIPGAVHIPLDELRKRYSELDRSKNYFVYCRSGRRSASATFLLRNQGFNAKNMLRGITGWPGEVVEGS